MEKNGLFRHAERERPRAAGGRPVLVAEADEGLWDALEAANAAVSGRCLLRFVPDPTEAWRAIHACCFCGVLVDWHVHLTGEVRLAEAMIESGLVELVAVTTRRHGPAIEVAARTAGATLYLPKPMSTQTLRQLLRIFARTTPQGLAEGWPAVQRSPPGEGRGTRRQDAGAVPALGRQMFRRVGVSEAGMRRGKTGRP